MASDLSAAKAALRAQALEQGQPAGEDQMLEKGG